MNIGIVTIGSRGDVQPFLALAKGLKKKGHNVSICAMQDFKKVIEEGGFQYKKMAGKAQDVMERLIGEQVSFSQYFRALGQLLNPIKEEFLKDIENACEGMDLMLYSTLGSVTYHVCEKKKIKCCRVFFCPLDPTSEHPTMTAPELPLGGVYNKFTYKMGDYLWANASYKLLNDWREKLGLPKQKRFHFPYREMDHKKVETIFAYSKIISPIPKEYGKHQHITGFMIDELDKEWVPDEELVSFINAGTKPLYIGFGSTVGGDFDSRLAVIIKSLQETGQRAILSNGWRKVDKNILPDNIMLIGSVPHEWLFKQVIAVSHHGGAGTTAAGIRAGVPSIIVPFGGDQPYWGKQVYDLGIGTKPILSKKLTVKNYSEAIWKVVNDKQMQQRAREIGEIICKEDGVVQAISVIEQILEA